MLPARRAGSCCRHFKEQVEISSSYAHVNPLQPSHFHCKAYNPKKLAQRHTYKKNSCRYIKSCGNLQRNFTKFIN